MNLSRNFIICPYLSDSDEGLICHACSSHIRNISDIDVEICLSKHYELCHIYFNILQNIIESEKVWFQIQNIQAGQASKPLLLK